MWPITVRTMYETSIKGCIIGITCIYTILNSILVPLIRHFNFQWKGSNPTSVFYVGVAREFWHSPKVRSFLRAVLGVFPRFIGLASSLWTIWARRPRLWSVISGVIWSIHRYKWCERIVLYISPRRHTAPQIRWSRHRGAERCIVGVPFHVNLF